MWKLKIAFSSIPILAFLACITSTPVQAAGLPQLDIATFPSQLIWLVITFAALFILMSRVSLPRISQVLEDRQHKIDDNLKKAVSFKEKAEIAAAAYTKAQAKAREEAYTIIMETHNQISDNMATRQAELAEELEAEIKAAEERIINAKEIAMAGIDDVATEVALSTTEKIFGESLDKKDVSKVIANILKEGQ
jgi:F-type H+-transporting ATPase subunit b